MDKGIEGVKQVLYLDLVSLLLIFIIFPSCIYFMCI